ncbi:MAG: hypothetical protein OXH13_00405 [Chloroflexi bacterium]|nr:hypothetical protein [Chloroflexota bacterium]MCY3695900.1 hypothetical protein [Chloroflexota bacterium]
MKTTSKTRLTSAYADSPFLARFAVAAREGSNGASHYTKMRETTDE